VELAGRAALPRSVATAAAVLLLELLVLLVLC
jgi:hypothetical protein